MSSYQPPVQDMMFTLRDVIGFDRLNVADLDEATMQAILEEGAKFASNVLAPLNDTGDREGARFDQGKVTPPAGFKDAYHQFCQMGWNGVPFDAAHGGQGFPWAFTFALSEMWQGANMAFGLCPMLTQAAVEAIEAHGTQAQKDYYLEKLVSGEWTGTMNLTEPHAGTDLGALRTRAVRQNDGTFKITGQKIFITYGAHDYTDNIVHMVIARIDGAPDGVKGISMFVMPGVLEDGSENDIACAGIEHKLGIHGSPTCTMNYGEKGGATAYLIGNEGEGLKYMFTMMNNARLNVGLQGVALAERAYQHALAYAEERVQSAPLDAKGAKAVPIIEHPDVRRMLLDMKAKVEAGRMMAYDAALHLDLARGGDVDAQARVDLLTPIVKAWCTDMAVDVASQGIQVHGGMGFIEETGAAQYYRDARILPIYEGTNGIQALDLSMRKILMDNGKAAKSCFDEIETLTQDLSVFPEMKEALEKSLSDVRMATDSVLAAGAAGQLRDVASVNVPYLRAFGTMLGGAMMARAALAAAPRTDAFAVAKVKTAQFYMSHILPKASAYAATVKAGPDAVNRFSPSDFRV